MTLSFEHDDHVSWIQKRIKRVSWATHLIRWWEKQKVHQWKKFPAPRNKPLEFSPKCTRANQLLRTMCWHDHRAATVFLFPFPDGWKTGASAENKQTNQNFSNSQGKQDFEVLWPRLFFYPSHCSALQHQQGGARSRVLNGALCSFTQAPNRKSSVSLRCSGQS